MSYQTNTNYDLKGDIMKPKPLLLVLIAGALLFLIPASSYALTFSYGGENVVFDGFDWAPDNALAVGAVPLSTNPLAPTSFDLLYQASLSSFTLGGGLVGSNLNTNYEITIVAGARESGYRSQEVTTIPGTPPTSIVTAETATFNHDGSDPNAINYFEIFLDPSKNHNPLAGTGYNDGISLISGAITGGNGDFKVQLGTFQNGVFVPTPLVPLDDFGTDDYPGIMTVDGSGVTENILMEADVTKINHQYILGTILALDISFRTDTATPFQFVDPAAQLYNGGKTNTAADFTAPIFGSLNGVTVNGYPGTGATPVSFLFEADARSKIEAEVVPEPGTIALVGFGLLGIAGLARRKNN